MPNRHAWQPGRLRANHLLELIMASKNNGPPSKVSLEFRHIEFFTCTEEF